MGLVILAEYKDMLVVLERGNEALLARFDLDYCIEQLDSVASHLPYHHIPNSVRAVWQQVYENFGVAGFDAFQRITLCRLVSRLPSRSRTTSYSDSINKCFRVSYARILEQIRDPKFEKYHDENDILLKDLALCCQRLFPAGTQVVETNSGFHRALLWRHGFRQAVSFLKMVFAAGGHVGWYQSHTHLSELAEFNPHGWCRFYRHIATMLKLNPDVRGVWSGSWYFDPKLEEISPNLSYLLQIPKQNGALVYFSNIDVNSGALAKSPTRKKLYAQGDYLPKTYVLIWPRDRLIRWADEKA